MDKNTQTIAFVGGSFKPPHKGHWDMVEEYAKKADSVVVLISKPSQKTVRKTKNNTVITPEQSKEIFEIYKNAYLLNNVEIYISDKPSPIFGIIDFINKHNIKNANIILGVSDKDDDIKRWTSSYIKEIINRIEQEPNNIKFLDPVKYATKHYSENKGASFVRDNIDNFEIVKDYLPAKLNLKQQKQVFNILNQNNMNESLVSKRKSLLKISKLSTNQTRAIFENIKLELKSANGYELTVNPKTDGSAVRIAWNVDQMFIETSHSGLISDPKQVKIPAFKNVLEYLQKPNVKNNFDFMLSMDLKGVKIIGELLYNSELDRDEDGGITFVATTYNSAKLGKIATIVIFDILKMTDDNLEDLDNSKKHVLMSKIVNDCSDQNIAFIDNNIFKTKIYLKYDDFSKDGQNTIDNLANVSKIELESLRDELNYQIVKTIDTIKKPHIVKGDIIEGLVFEIAGTEYAVQSEKWIQHKENIYKFIKDYDAVLMNFIKEITGYQLRKKILSIFDENKLKWQDKYKKLLPKFKKDLTNAYNNFLAHKNEIPKFVFNINNIFIAESYKRFNSLTDDIDSFKNALTPIKVESKTLTEGGHLFNDEVSRINQENVQATLDKIINNLIVPVFKLSKNDVAVLGTTGKKLPGGTSGDIDLGLDLTTMKKTINIGNFQAFKQYCEDKLPKLNLDFKAVPQFRVVSIKWPIENTDGKQENEFVQLDLMPVYDLNWIKFGEGHPHERVEKWKGAVRNQILMQIAAYRDRKNTKYLKINGKSIPVEFEKYSFSPRDGLFKQTYSIESKKDPTKVLKNPKKIKEILITSNVQEVLKILIGLDKINIDDFTTTLGTWNQFKKTDLWKNQNIKDKIISKIINNLNRDNISYPDEFENALFDKSLLDESILFEGGNAVSNVSRINKKNVNATITTIYDKLLPLLKINKKDVALLGSAGKKDSSEDLDLGINNIDNIKLFLNNVEKKCKDSNIECKVFYGLNEISIKWPIENTDGKQENEFVQLDLMPAKNLDILKWGMYSPSQEESDYKGVVRNILLTNIAAYKDRDIIEYAIIKGKKYPAVYSRYVLLTQSGLFRKTYSHKGSKQGLYKKNADKLNSKFITDNPDEIVKIILGEKFKASDVLTIDDLWRIFKQTDLYKNLDTRNKILQKTVDELKSRKNLKYPSYLKV